MALISYVTGTAAVPLIGKTIGEMFDEIAARYPDTEAVVSSTRGFAGPTANCSSGPMRWQGA